MGPDLTPDIFEALGLGFGMAGKPLQATESFILADNYDQGNPQTGKPEIMPVVLHPGSGRRFILSLRETATDTPPDPSTGAAELDLSTQMPEPVVEGQEFFTPTESIYPEGSPLNPEQSADGAVHPQPNPEDVPVERPEAIQAPVHEPQPETPPSNVPEDFELKVQLHDEQLQPGAPLPTPPEPQPED